MTRQTWICLNMHPKYFVIHCVENVCRINESFKIDDSKKKIFQLKFLCYFVPLSVIFFIF